MRHLMKSFKVLGGLSIFFPSLWIYQTISDVLLYKQNALLTSLIRLPPAEKVWQSDRLVVINKNWIIIKRGKFFDALENPNANL